MEYTQLGSSGLQISRIGLGCASFGTDDRREAEWTLDSQGSRELIEHAIDRGITFFDTANSYSWGGSERILGEVLGGYDRDRFVVASKVYFESLRNGHPNSSGLSRKAIEHAIEQSLDRLDMETIDLYQLHRWDPETPIEETVRTLDDAVRRGQVRYLGASSMWTYQFTTARHATERRGLESFVSMQNHYNLVYREEEREMVPYCSNAGIGVIPWSPLARGYLARPDPDLTDTRRGRTDGYLDDRIQRYRSNGGVEINRRVHALAEDAGVSMAQIALAWLLENSYIDAPIVGVTSIDQLDEAIAALEITLSRSDVAYLEKPYEPGPVIGHR